MTTSISIYHLLYAIGVHYGLKATDTSVENTNQTNEWGNQVNIDTGY